MNHDATTPVSTRDALAMRRDLLVATATLQRLRLVHGVTAPLARLRARWRGVALATQLVGTWLAPRTANRWLLWARLIGWLRDIFARPRRGE